MPIGRWGYHVTQTNHRQFPFPPTRSQREGTSKRYLVVCKHATHDISVHAPVSCTMSVLIRFTPRKEQKDDEKSGCATKVSGWARVHACRVVASDQKRRDPLPLPAHRVCSLSHHVLSLLRAYCQVWYEWDWGGRVTVRAADTTWAWECAGCFDIFFSFFPHGWMGECMTDRLHSVGVSFLAELSVRSCVVIPTYLGSK